MGKIVATGGIEYSAPVPLSSSHVCDGFDCGHASLNEWLRRFALQNQRADAAKTYVVCRNDCVAGFYSLAVGSVEHDSATVRVRKGLARHPIPVMILARLAVDRNHQGKRIGRGLLKDAVLRTLQASEIAGIRALFVEAKDERTKKFYERFGFEPSPVSPLQLMVLMKDLVLLGTLP